MATVKVMSAGAVQPLVTALGEEFARVAGHRLDLHFDTAGALRKRFEGGEHPDLLVLPAAVMATLDAAGAFVKGSRVDLARTVTGVAVKDGAPAPDISTPAAFKAALLAARAVAYSDPQAGGSSGTFFAGLLDRLGIAAEIVPKAVLGKRGYEVAEAVADGRADIGSTFVSEILTVPGVRVVGPLPGELHNANTYTAAIPRRAAAPEPASALLRRLIDPATRGRWQAAGLEPAFPGG